MKIKLRLEDPNTELDLRYKIISNSKFIQLFNSHSEREVSQLKI